MFHKILGLIIMMNTIILPGVFYFVNGRLHNALIELLFDLWLFTVSCSAFSLGFYLLFK